MSREDGMVMLTELDPHFYGTGGIRDTKVEHIGRAGMRAVVSDRYLEDRQQDDDAERPSSSGKYKAGDRYNYRLQVVSPLDQSHPEAVTPDQIEAFSEMFESLAKPVESAR